MMVYCSPKQSLVADRIVAVMRPWCISDVQFPCFVVRGCFLYTRECWAIMHEFFILNRAWSSKSEEVMYPWESERCATYVRPTRASDVIPLAFIRAFFSLA